MVNKGKNEMNIVVSLCDQMVFYLLIKWLLLEMAAWLENSVSKNEEFDMCLWMEMMRKKEEM